jgi:2-polyprenyl-3-methyl-5-hydroxy-6-metoxy-1,4-benzoquinol methylase
MFQLLKPTCRITNGYQHFKVSANKISLIGDGKNHKTKFLMMESRVMPLVSGLSVLDIGASNGLYSFSALVHGAKKVTALDNEREIVGGRNLFELEKIAVKLDFTNLETIQSCFSAHKKHYDVVFCLAVMHHLFYASAKPYSNLEALINHLASTSRKILIIEWVDPRGGGPYASRKPYTKKDFIRLLSSHFKEVDLLGVTNNYSNQSRNNRELYLCSK